MCFFSEKFNVLLFGKSEVYFILNLLWAGLACLMQDSLELQRKEGQALLKRTKSIKCIWSCFPRVLGIRRIWGEENTHKRMTHAGSGSRKKKKKKHFRYLSASTFQGLFQALWSVAEIIELNKWMNKERNTVKNGNYLRSNFNSLLIINWHTIWSF